MARCLVALAVLACLVPHTEAAVYVEPVATGHNASWAVGVTGDGYVAAFWNQYASNEATGAAVLFGRSEAHAGPLVSEEWMRRVCSTRPDCLAYGLDSLTSGTLYLGSGSTQTPAGRTVHYKTAGVGNISFVFRPVPSALLPISRALLSRTVNAIGDDRTIRFDGVPVPSTNVSTRITAVASNPDLYEMTHALSTTTPVCEVGVVAGSFPYPVVYFPVLDPNPYNLVEPSGEVPWALVSIMLFVATGGILGVVVRYLLHRKRTTEHIKQP